MIMKQETVSEATAQLLREAGFPQPKEHQKASPNIAFRPTGNQIIRQIIDRVIVIFEHNSFEVWTSVGRHRGVDFSETCAAAYLEWAKSVPF